MWNLPIDHEIYIYISDLQLIRTIFTELFFSLRQTKENGITKERIRYIATDKRRGVGTKNENVNNHGGTVLRQ